MSTVAGHRFGGGTCRWKALRAVKAAPFDEGAGEAVLVLRGPGSPGSRGATGSVRGRFVPPRAAVENTAPRQRCNRGALSSARCGGAGSSRTKLDGRRQTPIHLGSDCREVVRRRAPLHPGRIAPEGRSEAVAAARAAGSGVRRFFGCSCRRSVAEVGREASCSRGRGEPRGEPRQREIGRGGGLIP